MRSIGNAVGAALAAVLLVGAAWTGVGSAAVHGPASADSKTVPGSVRSKSDWPQFRGDPGLTGVAPGALPAEVGGLEVLWTYEAGGAITSSPAVVGGAVYFGADDSKVHKVDAETGEGVWAFETQDFIEAPPLVVDGGVFIGSRDFFFYALEAETGELRWKYETDDTVLGGANFVRTGDRVVVVFGSYDAKLYGFDAATGEKLWEYLAEDRINGTPAITDGRAVFGGCDTYLHVVDAATGAGVARVELGSDCHVIGSVALSGGRAYFGHHANSVVCADLAKEEVVWTYEGRGAFVSTPAIGTDRVVFGGRDRKLHCVGKADGEPLWTFSTRRQVDGSPVIAGDKVVFGSGDGRMYVLSLEDGSELWTYDVGKSILSSPAVVDGRIYVGANDDRLYAFGLASRPAEASATETKGDG